MWLPIFDVIVPVPSFLIRKSRKRYISGIEKHKKKRVTKRKGSDSPVDLIPKRFSFTPARRISTLEMEIVSAKGVSHTLFKKCSDYERLLAPGEFPRNRLRSAARHLSISSQLAIFLLFANVCNALVAAVLLPLRMFRLHKIASCSSFNTLPHYISSSSSPQAR
eukprot:NP_508840.1 Uncharacterized protein CELE_M03F4.4 [Caenorhabditis elegans]